MSSYNDVIVRPTEISFSNVPHLSRPVEVLILNRSQRRLRFKILCTARDIYALSKSKGTLFPEGFIKINIELLQTAVAEKNRRDFFKIQFFDCLDDSLQGERFLSAIVLPDPTVSSYRSLDSDSCNSWPNRSMDNLSVGSNPTRSLSLVRTTQVHSNRASQSSLKDDPKPLPTTLSYRGSQRTPAKPLTKMRTDLVTSSDPARLPQRKPPSTSWFMELLTYSIQRFVCLLAFLLCFIGICLPIFMDESTAWTHLLPAFLHRGLPTSSNLRSDDKCDPPVDETPGYDQVSSSCPQASEPHLSDRRARNLDEFMRHSQLAISSLKTALLNIYGALVALSPLTLVANLSWFCLGLLVMYTMRMG